jgi:hypothetical protein
LFAEDFSKSGKKVQTIFRKKPHSATNDTSTSAVVCVREQLFVRYYARIFIKFSPIISLILFFLIYPTPELLEKTNLLFLHAICFGHKLGLASLSFHCAAIHCKSRLAGWLADIIGNVRTHHLGLSPCINSSVKVCI